MTAPRQDDVKVNVKVKPGRDPRKTIADVLRKDGVLAATQLFPHETDPELAGLYLLDLSPAGAEKTIDDLRANRHLQYVENVAPRRLVR
jgi:hypothetical protein